MLYKEEKDYNVKPTHDSAARCVHGKLRDAGEGVGCLLCTAEASVEKRGGRRGLHRLVDESEGLVREVDVVQYDRSPYDVRLRDKAVMRTDPFDSRRGMQRRLARAGERDVVASVDFTCPDCGFAVNVSTGNSPGYTVVVERVDAGVPSGVDGGVSDVERRRVTVTWSGVRCPVCQPKKSYTIEMTQTS